jgi:hypothetical protein
VSRLGPFSDERVTYALDALRYFDSGNWVTAGALAPGMAARMADAVRGLLEVITEDQADAAHLAEIRAILAGFDWERDDRQYALERIEMIAGGDL